MWNKKNINSKEIDKVMDTKVEIHKEIKDRNINNIINVFKQEEFIKNYQGKDPLLDRLYMDIETRARKRYNKLFEDAMKDEHNRMDMLTNNLSKYYKKNKKKVKDFINIFEGTTIELFESLKYE